MALPTLTANSPSAGFIAWTSFSIRYGAVSVTIPAGNTNKVYAYWLWNGGAPAASLVFADVLPALTADDLLIFVNRGGIPINVTNANVIEGSIIATDSIIGTSIQANTVDASKLLADSITAREIGAAAVTANELSISSFGGLQAVNGEMNDPDATTKVPAGWSAAFERSGTAPTYAAETAAPLSGSTSVKITVPVNSVEAMAATATSCKAGDLISFGVACRASVVGAPITIRAYFGTSSTFTRTQLVAATPDLPTNVVVYDVTATGLVARSGQPTPVSGAGIAAPVDGWAAPVTTSMFVVGQVKVPPGATFVRFVLASGLTTSPAHVMTWDSLEYAPVVTSVKLADGVVTARMVAADAIDGKTITGATIRTAASGQRWVLGTGASSNTLYGYSGRADETTPYGLQSTTDGVQLIGAGLTGTPAGSSPAYVQVGNRSSLGYPKLAGGTIFSYAGTHVTTADAGVASDGVNYGGLWSLNANNHTGGAPSNVAVMGSSASWGAARIDVLTTGAVNLGGTNSATSTLTVYSGRTELGNATDTTQKYLSILRRNSTNTNPLEVRIYHTDGEDGGLVFRYLKNNVETVRMTLDAANGLTVPALTDPADTGWVTCTLKPGFAWQGAGGAEAIQVKKKHGIVYIRGAVSSTGITTNTSITVASLPAGFAPLKNVVNSCGTSSGAASAVAFITSGGDLQIRTNATLSSYYFFGGFTWTTD